MAFTLSLWHAGIERKVSFGWSGMTSGDPGGGPSSRVIPQYVTQHPDPTGFRGKICASDIRSDERYPYEFPAEKRDSLGVLGSTDQRALVNCQGSRTILTINHFCAIGSDRAALKGMSFTHHQYNSFLRWVTTTRRLRTKHEFGAPVSVGMRIDFAPSPAGDEVDPYGPRRRI